MIKKKGFANCISCAALLSIGKNRFLLRSEMYQNKGISDKYKWQQG